MSTRTRTRIAIALVLVFTAGPAAIVVYQAAQTLRVLTQVERERDEWQRPSAVLDALAVTEGSVVADVGAGAGYFSLKLAPIVGVNGRVLATDIRRVSLAFLWIRARQLAHWNVEVIHGEIDDPHLPAAVVDAALIANTYHELTQPVPILEAVHRSLKPGGRLVVLDRSPRSGESAREASLAHHELALEEAEDQILQAGFRTVSRETRFIDRPGEDDIWWLLVTERP